jgi:uncharacterized repeat protein (TIGR01451 family)
MAYIREGGGTMRPFALLVIILAFAGCATGREPPPVEEAQVEDTGVEEVALEESTEAQSETTVPSAAIDPGAVSSEQINAPPKKEEAVEKQDQAQADPTHPETTVPSATANSSGVTQSEQINASPEQEAVGTRDQAQAEEGVSTTQKAEPNPAIVGQPLTFTISVTNHSAPQRVGFKDFLPPGMTQVSVTPSQGTCGAGHHEGSEVGCTLGLVPSGGSATIEIVATPTASEIIKNTAVSLAEFTPATPASSNVVTVTVNPAT